MLGCVADASLLPGPRSGFVLAVHKRRFITPAFALNGGKIPNAIRAVLRSKFANANL